MKEKVSYERKGGDWFEHNNNNNTPAPVAETQTTRPTSAGKLFGLFLDSVERSEHVFLGPDYIRRVDPGQSVTRVEKVSQLGNPGQFVSCNQGLRVYRAPELALFIW